MSLEFFLRIEIVGCRGLGCRRSRVHDRKDLRVEVGYPVFLGFHYTFFLSPPRFKSVGFIA